MAAGQTTQDMAAGAAIGSVIPGVGTAIGGAVGAALPLLGNAFNFGSGMANKAAYGNAINGVNNSMDAYRTAYQNTLGNYQKTGENQFMNAVNTVNPALSAAQNSIAQQSSLGQQQAAGQTLANNARAGVRGGQSATIAGRAAGTVGENLTNQINDMAVKEAQTRQNALLGYTAQKGLDPYHTLTTNTDVYMPSQTEVANRYGAVAKQYGV